MGRRIRFLTPVNLFLFLILLLALFFRVYNIVELHGFAADADLYSWIVKDIVYGHLRLVGQMTSTEGVYAGPFFYYLLVPAFLITGMDPIGAVIFATILGLLTVYSYYFVFKKILGNGAGLIAGFLQAVLPLRVGFDRWVVPSITVNLWCIWFFYIVMKILRGETKYIIPGLFLAGLIWHVHLALAPLAILLPLAVLMSKKMPSKQQLLFGCLAFVLPMMPFLFFELRHQFIQTLSTVSSLGAESGIPLLDKTIKIFNQSLGKNFYLKFVWLLLPVILYRIKSISLKMLAIFYVWIFSVIGFFIISPKESSEYYFTSTQMVFLILSVYLLTRLLKIKKAGLVIVGIFLMGVFIYSANNLVNQKGNGRGYVQKMEAAGFIKSDSLKKNLPCFSITYITSPGEDSGFRYIFWFNKIKLEQPRTGIPNYTIVLPYNLSPDSVEKKSGLIGVIPPKSGYNLKEVARICSDRDFNLSQPMWGYSE